jgi:hypothetical protein
LKLLKKSIFSLDRFNNNKITVVDSFSKNNNTTFVYSFSKNNNNNKTVVDSFIVLKTITQHLLIVSAKTIITTAKHLLLL